jgi:hypothetical protein
MNYPVFLRALCVEGFDLCFEKRDNCQMAMSSRSFKINPVIISPNAEIQ